MAEYYASGGWQVTAGREEEFVERWTEFLQWTRKDHPGLLVATLLRDEHDAGHFRSVSEWTDAESRAAWKTAPEFAALLGACRECCDQMSSSDYTRVVSV